MKFGLLKFFKKGNLKGYKASTMKNGEGYESRGKFITEKGGFKYLLERLFYNKERRSYDRFEEREINGDEYENGPGSEVNF